MKNTQGGTEKNTTAKADITSAAAKNQRRMQDKQKIAALRVLAQKEKQEAAEKRKQRIRELAAMSRSEKRAFLDAEKAQKHKEKAQTQSDALKRQQDYQSLSPSEKKAYRQEQRHKHRLIKRAKSSYVPAQIIKYTLLAALLATLIYVGDIAYGAFIDNASAFHNTEAAVVKPSETPVPTPEPSASATVAPTPTPNPYDLLLQQADLDFMKNRVNILVLGIDESLERADWQTFRTDTMLLMSIDFDTNDVFMISLPRDSYVWIYNQDHRDKINTAFSEGGGYKKNGFEYAMKTVSMALGGVPVNNYVCFDMNVVKEVVNAIGGLYYDVDVNVSMCGRKIEKGYQYMDGQNVLDYCRQRHGSSDIARVDRQQRMILAIFNEIKSTGQLGDIPAIYSAVTGNIYTDLTLKQIASLAAFAMKVDLESIERHTLPGGFLNIDGTSFWGVDLSKTRRLVKDIFGATIKINESEDLETLLALAQEKRNVVASAEAAAANAESYVNANTAFISAEERADFQSRTADLRAVAAVKNTEDVSITIPPIYAAIDEFNAYFGTLQGTVEARKTEAAATQPPAPESPAPETSAPASPTPETSVPASPTPESSAPESTKTESADSPAA